MLHIASIYYLKNGRTITTVALFVNGDTSLLFSDSTGNRALVCT
jgi:hypothetical protein